MYEASVGDRERQMEMVSQLCGMAGSGRRYGVVSSVCAQRSEESWAMLSPSKQLIYNFSQCKQHAAELKYRFFCDQSRRVLRTK